MSDLSWITEPESESEKCLFDLYKVRSVYNNIETSPRRPVLRLE